jgi:hypothetical protein
MTNELRNCREENRERQWVCFDMQRGCEKEKCKHAPMKK